MLCLSSKHITAQSVWLQPLQFKLWCPTSALCCPFHLPSHLCPLSIAPLPWFLVLLLLSAVCVCCWAHPHDDQTPQTQRWRKSGKEERRGGRGGRGIQNAFKTWQQQSTSVWESESNSPALIIFKEAHVDGGGFQDTGPDVLLRAKNYTDKIWKSRGWLTEVKGRIWRKYLTRE